MVELYFLTNSFWKTVLLHSSLFLCCTVTALSQSTFTSPFTLSITFDQWPEESRWDIRIGDSTVVYSADYQSLKDESDNTTLVISDIHLVPANGYFFNFYDAFIDGICCIQGYGVFSLSDANGAIVLTGGEFEVKESVTFDVAGDLCTNGLKDNGETAVDCGGECTPCETGCMHMNAHNYNPEAIVSDSSCETCSDGILNGDESSIDCGGTICEPCSSNCPEDNYNTTDEITTDMQVSVNESIQSSHKVHSNLSVEFTAGQEIVLGAGFEIDTSTVFSAVIGGCVE